MSVTTGLFYIFATIMLVAAFRVITARNPVHAVLFLVLTFFQASMLWMLLKVEFLSLTLVLVYVGAVMVLFLFVVMMLEVDRESVRIGFWKHFPLAALLGVIVALEMAAVLMGGFRITESPDPAPLSAGAAEVSNVKELGKLLYTQYIYPLEIATAILLVAMIAAIALTLREGKTTKRIDPAEQVRVKAKDRMVIVKMDVTKPSMVDAGSSTTNAEKSA